MEYKYTPPGENYTAYAAGGVFYAAPGHTAFPVRLAVEVFRRCLALRAAAGATGPAVVYDPCCGSAYHLATMAYFNWEQIAAMYASDIDEDALGIARRNLSLLTMAGMDRRIAQVADLHQQYGKPSHAEALEHARVLRERLVALSGSKLLPTHLFRADATDAAGMATHLGATKVDVVLTDVPYGRWSSWHPDTVALAGKSNPIQQLLTSVRPHLAPGAVVVLASAKGENAAHPAYRRKTKFNAGTRQLVMLQIE